MGKQRNIRIRGKKGKLIFYIVNGEGRVRSAPKKVKRSAATKISAKDFGKAVRISAAVRDGLVPLLLPLSKGRGLINRVNKVCNDWLHRPAQCVDATEGEQPWLYGYQFNPKAGVSQRFVVPLQVDWSEPGVAVLSMPEIDPRRDIRAPANTVLVQCKVGITGCVIKKGWNTGSHVAVIDIPYTNTPVPAQRLRLPYETGKGRLTVVAVALEYRLSGKKRMYGSRQDAWLPAGIIATQVK